MATLRDTIQIEIVNLETALAVKKLDLANLEAVAPDFLGQEIDKVKQFFSFESIKRQLGL